MRRPTILMDSGEFDNESHGVHLPRRLAGPLVRVGKRLGTALLLLAFGVVMVYADRDGYVDSQGGELGFIDCLYYVTVSVSTAGYGDITPVTDGARLVNALVTTPLRIVFLIILVGTTLEVLTQSTHEQWRVGSWRKTLRDHTVIIGFGTKGRSAAETLMRTGVRQDQIVVVDSSPAVIEHASAVGFAGVTGDATRSRVLMRGRVDCASQVIVATERDDTAVLVSLTVRQLSEHARIVASVREEENVRLLRRSGAADSVLTSASAVGGLLGLSMASPSAGAVMEELIQQGTGLIMLERPVTRTEVGLSPRECEDLVVAVHRGPRLLGFDHPDAATLESTDRLVVIHRSSSGGVEESPPAPAKGGKRGHRGWRGLRG